MSTFPSPPLAICASCQVLPDNDRLFQVHVKSWSDTKRPSSNLSYQVCNQCLVNHFVPVHRPSNGKWDFGLVLSYEAASVQHQLVFTDGKKEWIQVPENPYSEYIEEFILIEDQSQLQSIGCSTLSFPIPYESDPEPSEKVRFTKYSIFVFDDYMSKFYF
jgi:hypothetical protein